MSLLGSTVESVTINRQHFLPTRHFFAFFPDFVLGGRRCASSDPEIFFFFKIVDFFYMHLYCTFFLFLGHCGSSSEMQSDEGIAEESFKYYNRIGNLCQDNRFGTLASAADIVTQVEAEDMSEQIINFILDELIGDIVQYCECSGFTEKNNIGEDNGFTEKINIGEENADLFKNNSNNEEQFALTHNNGDIENHHHISKVQSPEKTRENENQNIKVQYDILNKILCDPGDTDNPYLEQNNLTNGFTEKSNIGVENEEKDDHENIIQKQCKNDILNHVKPYPIQIPNQIDYSNSISPLCNMNKIQSESELFLKNNDTNNNNFIIEDFAQALADEVIHEILIEEEEKDLYHDHEDPDELFLVLHPPTHEDLGPNHLLL